MTSYIVYKHTYVIINHRKIQRKNKNNSFFKNSFFKSGIDAINWTSYHPQKPQFSIKNKDLVAFEFPHELILDGVENYGDCS